MKNKYDLFKNAPDLLDEQEVQTLMAYCEKLEDEMVDLKFELQNNKSLIMLDMIKEVLNGCVALEKEQLEHERFGYPPPDYMSGIIGLKRYIIYHCRENKIWL